MQAGRNRGAGDVPAKRAASVFHGNSSQNEGARRAAGACRE